MVTPSSHNHKTGDVFVLLESKIAKCDYKLLFQNIGFVVPLFATFHPIFKQSCFYYVTFVYYLWILESFFITLTLELYIIHGLYVTIHRMLSTMYHWFTVPCYDFSVQIKTLTFYLRPWGFLYFFEGLFFFLSLP